MPGRLFGAAGPPRGCESDLLSLWHAARTETIRRGCPAMQLEQRGWDIHAVVRGAGPERRPGSLVTGVFYKPRSTGGHGRSPQDTGQAGSGAGDGGSGGGVGGGRGGVVAVAVGG